MKILVGEISSYKAVVAAKFLSKSYPDFDIYSYDYRSFTSSIRTKYTARHFIIPFKSLASYIKVLSELVKKEGIDFLIPVHSIFITEILKNKELFGGSLDYVGNYQSYIKLHDKRELYNIVGGSGIIVPEKYQSYDTAKIPFVFKPSMKSSAHGVKYIYNLRHYEKYKSQAEPQLIYQEIIKGNGCGYSVYAEKGKILEEFGHLRLVEYPVSGGSSAYRRSFMHTDMRKTAEHVLKMIPWTGFVMFEFKLTPENKLVLIEINPRIWGSFNQGLQNNVNYFKPILGKARFHEDKGVEVFTYLSPHIYFNLLLYLIKGQIKPLIIFLKNLKHNKADVNIFDDFKGWLSLIARKIL